MKIINYLFQAILIYFLFFVGLILGINLSRKIFSFLFLIIGPIFKSKKIIKKNLLFFKNNITHIEIDTISKNMWKNYGMTFIEYIFLNFLRKNNSHIKVIGEENLDKLIHENRQVIFISGHFANFELMSMEITKRKINLATIYRPLNNFFLNPFMEYMRKKYVCDKQIKKGIQGVRESIEYINQKYSIALMVDQRVSEGEKVNFFSHPALTTTLPAQLS